MGTFIKLTLIQVKLYFRDPLGVFFTLAFAPLLMLIIGLVSGNDPDPLLGGIGFLDYSISAYIAIIIGVVGLIAIPIDTATKRETGTLRRFAVTPLKPVVYFFTDILAPLIVTILGILLLLLIGRLLFRIRFEGSFLILVAVVCFSAVSLFSIGYGLGGIAPSARSATVIANLIAIPILFFSGAYMPIHVMPDKLQNAARFLPLIHIVNLLRGVWFREPLKDYYFEILILVVMLLVGTIIISITFKWE